MNTPKFAEDGLDAMFSFLMMGNQEPNIHVLKENCDALRRMLTQKTAGQKGYAKKDDISFDDVWTVCNIIVIEAMQLYLSGALGLIEGSTQAGEDWPEDEAPPNGWTPDARPDLPARIGQTVYVVRENRIEIGVVEKIIIQRAGTELAIDTGAELLYYDSEYIGNAVFFSKGEARKAVNSEK